MNNKGAKVKKVKFECEGCGVVIEVDDSIPERRVFTWTGEKDGVEHDYCADCDWLLIQDQPLPRKGGKDEKAK